MAAAVTVPPLVAALPYVAWILLATLAFGSMAFVVVTRQLTDVTLGYARFTAVTAAVLAFLARLVDGGLTDPPTSFVHQPSQDLATLRWIGLVLFVVLSVAYAAVAANKRAALVVGAMSLAFGAIAAAAGAFGWATSAHAIPFLVQVAALSLVTGGSMAAIVLGHWYLVTPKISERPLILQCQLLLAVLIVQALLFVTWTTLGGGPGQTAFSAFTTGPVLLVALRLVVTIAFPIVLVWMAWRTSLTRSMESATGLLYINFAAVLAGTIGAAALYVSSGILV
jgi:hypothetical protein